MIMIGDEIIEEVLRGNQKQIIIDFHKSWTPFDETMYALEGARRECIPRGKKISLVALHDSTIQAFTVMKLDMLYSIHNTANDAMIETTKMEVSEKIVDSLPGVPYRKSQWIGHDREVLGVLNKGGMGIVYLVVNHATNQETALKTYRDEYLQSESMRLRFIEEAKTWISLGQHPNIVSALSAFEFENRPYLEMLYIAPDYAGRITLRDHIKDIAERKESLYKDGITLERIIEWGLQFCYGMSHAQAQGLLCHRDIKPENLMMDKWEVILPDTESEKDLRMFDAHTRVLRISDFGLAKVFDRTSIIKNHQSGQLSSGGTLSIATMEGAGCGTPPYMAPEQFTDAASADIRNDIYSFGITLYEISMGTNPFVRAQKGDSNLRDYWQQMYELQSSFNPDPIDSPIWEIVEKCISKRPEQRYQNIKELSFAFRNLAPRRIKRRKWWQLWR